MEKKLLIDNTPTSKIRSLAMGFVEVYGKAIKSQYSFKSPFTNSDCVYYRYSIEEYRKQGKSSKWVMIKQDSKLDYFYLQDDTGMVLVDTNGAEIDIPADYEFETGIGRQIPSPISNFLKTENIDSKGFFGFNKKLRFREYYIAPNDMLYVMGTADDNPFVKEASSEKNEADIMIQKGKHQKFYYISDRAEKEILASLKWKIILGIFGGGVLAVACLAFIFVYFGML